ncbi:MAG: acyl carrier protein [Alphaproteobacteria bacterium]|jgi:acyl carrier protein|nr:acyl carrier protein [Alphaproteobacteria bacterium]MDP6563792.1 acyl carrier protein [Alphaproteobacteria bacterium]MDP6811771.1 acyl carrier protein [Alphaproteobacteria bacterium]
MTDLHEVASEVLKVPVGELSDDSSPKNLKAWDSLKHIELMMAIETNYGMQFAPSEIMMINSLGSARAMLQEKGITV